MHRPRGGIFDTNPAFGIDRPASTQGRFVNTSPQSGRNRFNGGPPGLQTNLPETRNDILQDPQMLQALQTLQSAGNLTPQQMQQIQMQLAINSRPLSQQSQNQWDKKHVPATRATAIPTRGYASANTSPQQKTRPEPISRSADNSPIINGGGESPVRSALLEEFRTNKNRKYELRVFFTINHARISVEALLSSAVISTDLDSFSKNWKFVLQRRSKWFLMK